MKKKILTVTAAALSLLFCGCGLITSADSLMSPPKLTEEQSNIYTALTKSIGTSINLVYPETGSFRSAYIINDIDGDNISEAIVFYKKSDEADSDNSVRMNIFQFGDNGKWSSVYDHAGVGVSVDSVNILRLGEKGRTYLTVGYKLMSSGDKTLQIYSYKNGILNTEYSETYSSYITADLTENSCGDIIILKENDENDPASIQLVSDTGSGIELEDSISLNSGLVSAESVTSGRISEKTAAVFVDEMTAEGTVSTEIIYCVDGSLRNPASVEGSSIIAKTARPKGYYSMDIDGDGITEIPVTEPMPGYENETEQLMLTKWNIFENYEIKTKYSGWFSRSDGWCMMFPGRWKDLVTVRIDSASGAVLFCRYDTPVSSSPELLRIITASNNDTEKYLESGYTLIDSDDDVSYLVKYADSSDSLILTATELKNNFFVYKN